MADRARIVIVGGGPGGYEAALVATQAGAEVTIVSREGLGGNSVLWDCVPSKTLIVSAEAMGWLQSAHRLGVRPADGRGRPSRDGGQGPPGDADVGGQATVDMGAVMDRVRTLAANQSADVVAKVEAAGTRVLRGVGRLDGPAAVCVEEAGGTTRVEADVVLVATGSRARVLPFYRPDGERVFTSRELYGLRALPERLIVVGSGATGAEYAHAFARFGSQVHLVSSRDQILPSEDPDAVPVIEDSFKRWGAVIHRRQRARAVEVGADGVRVRTGDAQWVEGTHVLFCVGQVPVSTGLGLAEAGVRLTDEGFVPVDRVSRTNVRTVYAAGDVTGRIMLASVAAMQGRTAMWHALGEAVEPLPVDALAACVFTDPEVATAGRSAADLAEAQIPVDTVMLRFAGNPRAKMAETTEGFVKIHALRGSGTVLGGVVVADRASELVAPLSLAVSSRLTVSQLARAFTIYPSMSGSVAEAARLLMGRQALQIGGDS